MVQGNMNFIEVPLGKIGTDQPTLLPSLKLPLPKNTNPVDIEIKTDTDEQTIATATTQTLTWDDSVTVEKATASALLTATTVASITVIEGGIENVVGTNVSITGGGGTGATATVTAVSFGVITAVTVNNPGSGYTSTPTATPDQGKQAVLLVVLTDTTVDSITVDNGGLGYGSVPDVVVSDPENPGSTATATATLLGDSVDTISVDTPGSGYQGTSTVSIASPTGVETPIIETSGTTLCMILFDGVTNLVSGQIEVYATDTVDTVDLVTDELLYVSHGTLNTGEFLWPVTPIWLPLNKFLTIVNTGATTITVNRVQTINFEKYTTI